MQTILFVDDNSYVREFCQAELEDEGYRVVLARDGYEALQLFRRERPDVVVLDVRMPRMNGLQTVQHILAEDRNIPVIFYTAHHRDYVHHLSDSVRCTCVEKGEDLTELKLAVALALIGADLAAN